MDIVYEYTTRNDIDGKDRIVGYQAWNLATYPEKAVFAKNQAPTEDMSGFGALFDDDKLPRFVLFDNGNVLHNPIPESIKIQRYDVMKLRFDRDYPQEKKTDLTMILLDESGSTHPDIVEFKRRKKEVDDLKP